MPNVVSARFQAEEYNALVRHAAQHNVALADVVRHAIRQYMDRFMAKQGELFAAGDTNGVR